MAKTLFRKILVAINGSEPSIRAAMYGILMAKSYRLDLKFVFVVDTATIKRLAMSKFFASDEKVQYEENLKTDGKKFLAYAADLANSKGVNCEVEMRQGAVWSEIIKAADEYEADCILLGGYDSAESRDEPRPHVLHPTQSEIISGAKCSVIVVKQANVEQLFKIL